MAKSDAAVEDNTSASIWMHVAAAYTGHCDPHNHVLQARFEFESRQFCVYAAAELNVWTHRGFACVHQPLTNHRSKHGHNTATSHAQGGCIICTPGVSSLGLGFLDTFMVRGP